MICLLLPLCFLFSKLLDYAALGKWGALAMGGEEEEEKASRGGCFSHPIPPTPQGKGIDRNTLLRGAGIIG